MKSTARILAASARSNGVFSRRFEPGTLRFNLHGVKPLQYSILAKKYGNYQQNLKGTYQDLSFCNFNRCLSTAAVNVTAQHNDELLKVQFQDGSTVDYSYVWLRDSCQCPKCHQPSSKSRLLRMRDLPTDCKPKEIKIEGANLTIVWDDDHVSPYPLEWLQERGYSHQNLEKRAKVYPLPAEPWGNEFLQNIPNDSFNNLMTDDRALYEWICKMEKFGFFLIKDTSRELGCLEEFAKRIAFLRYTNYGKSFSVKAKIDPSNAAYTSAALGLHCDLPYYYYTPGVQMLHCIKQVPTKGGENQFADGFHVAEVVKKLRPDYYKILCTSLVDFYDIGTDYYKFHKFARRPVIQFDTTGNMTQINYNNQVRDYFSHLPAKELTALFKAMKFYDDISYQPENLIQLKLKDGEVACFHNYRVMHGREGFKVIGGGERHYEGGYLDWDELHSRRRVLQQELNL